MTKTATIIFILLWFFLCYGMVYAQEGYIESPFNHLKLKLTEEPRDYSFQVAGHMYGATKTQDTRLYPSSSVLCNLDRVTCANQLFFISLGDFVPFAHTSRFNQFEKLLLARFNVPFFNVLGNHEGSARNYYGQNARYDRSEYVMRYGEKTYGDFRLGNEIFILLDAELKPGDIQGEQLDYLLTKLEAVSLNKTIKNVLIFSHKIVWCVNSNTYKVLYDLCRPFDYPATNSYKHSIEPMVRELAKTKNVYWVSSEIGPRWSYDSLFYHKVPDVNLTYIATGLGDRVQDKMLTFDVKRNGHIRIVPVSLSDREPESLEYYGLEYWNTLHRQRKQQRRGLWPRLKRLFQSRHFWYGFAVSFAVFGCIAGGVVIFWNRGFWGHAR